MCNDNSLDPVDYFKHPKMTAQRRYEALRAYYLESLTQDEAAKKVGYSVKTFQSLISNFQNGKINFFMKSQYGPKRRQISDYDYKKIISLRKADHSIYEIQEILASEDHKTSLQTINRILKDEGFNKLQRRTGEERGISKRNTLLPKKASPISLDDLDKYKFECQVGGIFYFIPYILQTGLYELIISSSFPETSQLSKVNSIFSILALKLIGHERLSKISNYNHDAGFGLFAGLNVPPKTTATSTYSYMVDRNMIMTFMQDFISQMKAIYPSYYQGETINLDFHSIPHYGEKSKMENNWVGAKHRSMKSASTFFAQDGDSKHLIYTNTDIDHENWNWRWYQVHYIETARKRYHSKSNGHS